MEKTIQQLLQSNLDRRKYMKKNFTCILLTIILIVTLSACAPSMIFSKLFGKTDEEIANDRMEEVFECIKQKDKDSLIKLSSIKAINESGDIEADAESLFSFMCGEILSLKNPYGSPNVREGVEDGIVTKQLESWYIIKTEETRYWIILFDNTVDQGDSENVGFYSMIVLETKDDEKLDNNWDTLLLPGIHLLD